MRRHAKLLPKLYIISMRVLLTTVFLSGMLAAACAQAFPTQKLDQFLTRLAEKNKAMGTLQITKDGKKIYSRAIGFSHTDGASNVPLAADTRYRIGSVTKVFTATMIFQLAEQGKLKIDDNLGKYFPQVPNASNITLAQILAHRSGIHDISEDREFRAKRLDGLTKAELLALVAKTTPDFDPGVKYAYSNTGYQLLGMVIEKVTGKRYEEVLKANITSKLGLTNTYEGASIDVNKKESHSYRYLAAWEKQPETNMTLLFGSGSLVSTVGDMARFIEGLFDLKLVSKGSLLQMTENGLGMTKFTHNGKTLYGHTGGIDGFGTWLAYYPEEKLTLSYGTNGKVYPVAKIIDGVFDIYWNKPFEIPAFETVTVSADILDKYVGVYSIAGAPVKFTVSRNDAALMIQMTGQSAIPLETISENKFGIESAGIVFEFDAAKKQMTQRRGDRERVFVKEE